MSIYLLTPLAVVAAYLIGAVPFGYLIFYWARGVDIRTVGSGNIGATNVGRNLGFRFFVVVFGLDLAKGLLPTWGLPKAIAALAGASPPAAAVLIAIAAILGHNFPVYLKFQGGKGVATSLGAMLALNWVASVASTAGFVVFLLVTKYVSLSSLLGGLAFVAVYFLRVGDPWDREHGPMSVLTIALMVLLCVRHRKNLVRIGAGTEPKVTLRRKRQPPSGRIAWVYLIALAAVPGVGGYVALRALRRPEVTAGRFVLTEVARAATGHQRADRVAFAEGGRKLAVTCPRYNRLVIYDVTDAETLLMAHDLELAGQPVAVCARDDRFYVLQRPAGDARHIEPGWWETFAADGKKLGSRSLVDFYPDDMALTTDGTHAVVLTSGSAEGGANRPAPALSIVELDGARIVGRLTFDQSGDDPARVTLSVSGRSAAVTLLGSNETAAIDLSDLAAPRLIGRSALPALAAAYASATSADAILMPSASQGEAAWVARPDSFACTLPQSSGLRLYQAGHREPLGELPLKGPLNLGRTRPTGLAFTPDRGLFAVANRSGGVHLIALRLR